MLSHYYNVDISIDGSQVTPLAMNDWLFAHNGYANVTHNELNPPGTLTENLLDWNAALKYLGTTQNGKPYAQFAYQKNATGGVKITNTSVADANLSNLNPIIAYKGNLGHFFVIDAKQPGASTYSVRDPYFYNNANLKTPTSVANHTHNYNNSYDYAVIPTKLASPRRIAANSTLYLASPAELLVTDSNGSKVGTDPRTGVTYSDMPDATYDTFDSIVTSETELDPSQISHTKVLYLPDTANQAYTIQVIGTGTGTYQFTGVITDDNGDTTSHVFTASTTPNQVDAYDYSSTSDGQRITLPLTVTADSRAVLLGSPIPALTATLSGFAASTPSDVTGAANCSTAATASSPVGTYPITCTVGTLSSRNYSFKTFVAGTLTIQYRWDGFSQPINDTAHQQGNASVFKAGSTVPVKFQLKKADGTVIKAVTAPQWIAPQQGSLMTQSVNESLFTDPADTSTAFAWQTDHYQYNWSTKGLQAGYWYKISAKLDDGTVQSVVLGLK